MNQWCQFAGENNIKLLLYQSCSIWSTVNQNDMTYENWASKTNINMKFLTDFDSNDHKTSQHKLSLRTRLVTYYQIKSNDLIFVVKTNKKYGDKTWKK